MRFKKKKTKKRNAKPKVHTFLPQHDEKNVVFFLGEVSLEQQLTV